MLLSPMVIISMLAAVAIKGLPREGAAPTRRLLTRAPVWRRAATWSRAVITSADAPSLRGDAGFTTVVSAGS